MERPEGSAAMTKRKPKTKIAAPVVVAQQSSAADTRLQLVRDHVRATLATMVVKGPAALGYAAAFKEIRAIVDPIEGDVFPVGRALLDRLPKSARTRYPLLFDPNVRYAERRDRINEISYGKPRRKIRVDRLNPFHALAWNITAQGKLVKEVGIPYVTTSRVRWPSSGSPTEPEARPP